MSHPARPGLPPAVSRARWLLMGLFGLTGIIFSSWLARIPSVRDLLDLSTSELGLMLLIGSLGALLTVTFAGMVVQRFGSRTSLLLSTAVLAVGYVLMGVGPTVGSVPLLGVGIFLNGVAIALGNVPLNVESARIERAMGRTVIRSSMRRSRSVRWRGRRSARSRRTTTSPSRSSSPSSRRSRSLGGSARCGALVLDDAPGDRPRSWAVPVTEGAVASAVPTGRRRKIAAARSTRGVSRARSSSASSSWQPRSPRGPPAHAERSRNRRRR